MSWSKFNFNCRFLSQKLSETDDFENAQVVLLEKYGNHQVGGDLPENSAENKLFSKIIEKTDDKNLPRILSIYGKLDLSWDLSALTKLNNIRNYLFFLFTVFLFLSSIYRFFVLPEFINIFNEMEHQITGGLKQFNNTWLVTIFIMVLISIVLLRFGAIVNKIGRSDFNFDSSIFTRLFIPDKIVIKLKHIEALSYAPIEHQLNEFSTKQIEIYKNFIADNLNVTFEIQTLLTAHRASLLKLINAQIAKLLALFALTVIGAIGYLVWSIYQPVFSLGMIL